MIRNWTRRLLYTLRHHDHRPAHLHREHTVTYHPSIGGWTVARCTQCDNVDLY